MTTPWRRLALAAALFLTAGTGVAVAQTVTVRNTPAGAPVEILFDGSVLVSGKADQAGEARLPITLQVTKGDWESDVRVYVDVCGELHRVGLVDRLSLAPTPGDGCERRDVSGLYVIKAVTNLFVDVGGSRAVVYLRQGPLPKEWMTETPVDDRPLRLRRPSPTGLVVFGGGGLTTFGAGLGAECGDVSNCTPDRRATTIVAGATAWITRWLAVEGAYVKPTTLKVSGSGSTYRFDSSFESQFITAVGKVGFSFGPFRPYGIGGANYHRSLRRTNQVTDARTITVDDVATTFPEASQTWATATDGVGWVFGGGAEVWLSSRVGLFGEITRAKMKGKGLDNTEGYIDERTSFFWGGVRVRIGRK